MSSTIISAISPGLDVDPRENLALWIEAIGRRASSKCTSYNPRGILWGACTDVLWTAINGGVVTARPQFPHPGPLDPAANPAARTIHDTALKAHADHTTALAEIKAAILESLGEANCEHIRDPVLGLHTHTPLAIIAAIWFSFTGNTLRVMCSNSSKTWKRN